MGNPRTLIDGRVKTYTRKRPVYKEIENVHDLCRLCLEKADEPVPIYKNDSGNDCGALALRIMMCVGLEMTKEDCLPNKICQNCHKALENFYSFRKKCEASYQKLKFHTMAVREKEYKQNEMLKSQMVQNSSTGEKKEDGKEGSNLVFTINMDGTITLSENNITADEPLVVLERLKDNANFMPGMTVNVNLEKKAPTETPAASYCNKQSLLKVNGLQSNPKPSTLKCSTNTSTNSTDNPTIQILQDNTNIATGNTDISTGNTDISTKDTDISMKESDEMDFSTFFSSMLIELGVVNREGDVLEMGDTNVIELDTGDGQQVTFVLSEESEMEVLQETKSQDDGKQNILGIVPLEKLLSFKNERKINWCKQCAKSFASPSVLARHFNAVHKRIRPYTCRTCGRGFAQKEVMMRHEKVHDVVRPFQCTQCPRSFTQRAGLLAHAKAHLPPHARSFSLHHCSLCPKVFLYASGLSRHMSQHAGRMYPCPHCGREFNDLSSLQRHSLRTHNVRSLPPPALTPKPANHSAG